MARGSQSSFPQAIQPLPSQRAPGPHLLPGGARPSACRPRHVRRAARDSGCTRVGDVPEVGSFNAITRESKVWASGLTPPFGHLLWAARSAVACPGCPWCGAAWHGGCALLPRWWSAPEHSCRGSIPRVGSFGCPSVRSARARLARSAHARPLAARWSTSLAARPPSRGRLAHLGRDLAKSHLHRHVCSYPGGRHPLSCL